MLNFEAIFFRNVKYMAYDRICFATVTNINFRKDAVSVRDPNINEFITTLDVHSNIMTPMRRSFITVGPK